MNRISKCFLMATFLFSTSLLINPSKVECQENQDDHKFYGSQSMTDKLLKVLVKRPDTAFSNADPIHWHYTSSPELILAQKEHDDFVKILIDNAIEVHYHDEFYPELADAIFVHDPVIITNKGAIILKMGKLLRNGEEEAIEKKLNSIGIPTSFKIKGNGTVEGGDILWLDEKTLAVGHGFRTNQEGINQLTQGLKEHGVQVLQVELPYWEGEHCCLHLQSLISLVEDKTALIYPTFLPVSFIQELKQRDFKLIEVPHEEFLSMGPNVLALSSGLCVTIEGNPITKQRLEENGITVLTYKGNEISLKAEGGATCLTRPLLRANL